MNSSFKKRLLIRSLKLIHIILIIAVFYICWKANSRRMHTLIAASIFGASYVMLSKIYNAYSVGMFRVGHLVYSMVLAQFLGIGLAYAAVTVRLMRFINPAHLVVLMSIYAVTDVLYAFLLDRLYFRLNKPRKSVVVYRNEKDLKKLSEINEYPRRFKIAKYVKSPDNYEDLIREVEGYSVIFVVGIPATLRNGLVKYCVETGVKAYIHPHVGDLIMSGARPLQMFSVPILQVQRAQPSPEYLFIKRLIDIIASLAALVVLSPIMLITAIAITAYDKGPVFYTQTRITKDRKEFRMWKFRSMCVNAEKDGVPQLSGAGDSRITPVGKIIRACRIDELPQLFNILMGDMTIVGPRPERPVSAEQYEREIPAFALRLQVKAGLTGYAQVYGKYNTEPYDKLQMDLMYINRMSIFEDIRLMFATVKILFMRESTQGYSADQVSHFEDAQAEMFEEEE
ncbi:MAG: exopolysaccharide biosynthesis polyprenyl glycosylphosphotransferase [Clostridia bacterium]|nr:exopolysaccharide biosynthesis polyprenyl glycosylphosphotransferase [Clostridia bacterium]